MKKILCGLLIIVMFVVSGCGGQKGEQNVIEGEQKDMESAYQMISMSEAKKLMETEEDYIILDVRTEAEYAEGHIPEAICIPNETIGSKEIAKLPDKEQLILVYCRSGNRSKQASDKLVKLGYSNIIEFGGIIDWDGEIAK